MATQNFKRKEREVTSVVSDSFETPWIVAHQTPPSMGFSRQEYWSELPFPPPGIFPTQGWNLGLPHARQMLYHLSHLLLILYREGGKNSLTLAVCFLLLIKREKKV